MAVIKGKSGSVSLTGTYPAAKIANIKSWTLNGDFGSGDTTGFGASDTTSIQLLRTTTGQLSGDLSTHAGQNTLITQMSNTGTLAGVVMRFVCSTDATQGRYFYAADAQLTNISLGAEVAGVQSFSASVNCSGGVKYPAS
ncbi:MAG: hypothetical protein IMZ61_04690 [Planctomycetes bacterium]|nr:hypothetical protein [Planctomycetota bacterium]